MRRRAFVGSTCISIGWKTVARRLEIPAPSRSLIAHEIAAHCPHKGRAVVKLIVTRGPGTRGYLPPDARSADARARDLVRGPSIPTRTIEHGISMRTCQLRARRESGTRRHQALVPPRAGARAARVARARGPTRASCSTRAATSSAARAATCSSCVGARADHADARRAAASRASCVAPCSKPARTLGIARRGARPHARRPVAGRRAVRDERAVRDLARRPTSTAGASRSARRHARLMTQLGYGTMAAKRVWAALTVFVVLAASAAALAALALARAQRAVAADGGGRLARSARTARRCTASRPT